VVYGWDPDVPAPDGYALDSNINGAMLGNGIAMLAGAYLTSVLVAAVASESTNDSGWSPLFVPVVGPFIGIGSLKPNAGGLGLLVADGTFQAAGAIALVLAFVDVEYKVVRRAGIDITPVVGSDVQGINTTVSF
jgi:hypothetical protein